MAAMLETNAMLANEAPAHSRSFSSAEATDNRKFFIGALANETTAESLRDYYSRFGGIEDAIVMKDPTTGKSRRFGFVTFTTREELDKAMANRPHEIDGRVVDPKRAMPRGTNGPNISTQRLYLSGIREGMTEAALLSYFGKYGHVIKAEIILDRETGRPRGYAFVTFSDYDSVDQCVLEPAHYIGGAQIVVKKGLNKDEMQRYHEMQERSYNRRTKRDYRGIMRGGPGMSTAVASESAQRLRAVFNHSTVPYTPNMSYAPAHVPTFSTGTFNAFGNASAPMRKYMPPQPHGFPSNNANNSGNNNSQASYQQHPAVYMRSDYQAAYMSGLPYKNW